MSSSGYLPTQGSNSCFLHLLHCRQILYLLSHGGSHKIVDACFIKSGNRRTLRHSNSEVGWQVKHRTLS